jgi:hypothetical protein
MLAPVLITVYNRYDHLKECITYLLDCSLASQTEVFVSSDAPSKKEDFDVISRIRAYLKTITGFKTITVIETKQNLGSFKNFLLSINEVFKSNDRIIFLEDDCLVSPQFLDYMNNALQSFSENNSIFSVAGYNYPVSLPPVYGRKTFLWQGFSAWGVGLWRNKWSEVDWSTEYINNFIFNLKKVNKTMRNANNVLPILYYSRRKGRHVADAIISINMIDKGLYSVFPGTSLVKNIGTEGSGESGVRSSKFIHQQINLFDVINDKGGPRVYPIVSRALYDYFRIKPFTKIKFYIRLFILYKLFGLE